MYKQRLSAGLILFVYILITLSCGDNGKKVVKDDQNQKPALMEVSIGGMMCTGCEETIQNNVGKLEGIKSVKASFKTGEALIEYSGSVADTAKIREAIIASGYTVKKFNLAVQEEGEK
jgi:copper chaperone CopZ